MNILNIFKYLSPLLHTHSNTGMEGTEIPGISQCTGMLGWDLGLGSWGLWAAFPWVPPKMMTWLYFRIGNRAPPMDQL